MILPFEHHSAILSCPSNVVDSRTDSNNDGHIKLRNYSHLIVFVGWCSPTHVKIDSCQHARKILQQNGAKAHVRGSI